MQQEKQQPAVEQTATVAWQDYYKDNGSAKFLDVEVTAYCPCHICCGKCDGITSSGKPAQANRTIAIDPAVIPLGTMLYLEGIGVFVAEDTGGAIKGNKIDLFMNDHQQALEFGVRTTKAYILQEKI